MTTPAAARLYEAQHVHEMEGLGWAVFNPHAKPINELPVIYGFNNGGSPGWYSACLLAEDGTGMGGHLCSSEAYMPHDLGVLEGASPDRHEDFRQHYPDGYRMEFVGAADVLSHPGIAAACEANKRLAVAAAEADETAA